MGDVLYEKQVRWRLVLGRYANRHLNPELNSEARRKEQVLDYLYSREYGGRGMRGREGALSPSKREGSLDPSQMSVPKWLGEVRELFPRETIETIERHAMERYDLKELVTDKAALEKMEPNQNLLKAMLSLKGHMKADVLNLARKLIRQIVDELKEQMAREIMMALAGRMNRFRHSPLKIAQNFDWRGTIRENLKNYQPDKGRLILHRALFHSRVQRRMPWRIILCVDQSGSMVDSVIHSAVIAGILAGLPALSVNLVVFDTSVVDLSMHVDDPVEILMGVQLGGGTNIGQALNYCERLIEQPQRTVLALISDFYEGAPPKVMFSAVKRMQEAGVTLIGLGALDAEAVGSYDQDMARRLAALGMDVTVATPKQFAEWLAKRMT